VQQTYQTLQASYFDLKQGQSVKRGSDTQITTSW